MLILQFNESHRHHHHHHQSQHQQQQQIFWISLIDLELDIDGNTASATTMVALLLFTRLQFTWNSKWYLLVACAMMMAGAICSMHYTGMLIALRFGFWEMGLADGRLGLKVFWA